MLPILLSVAALILLLVLAMNSKPKRNQPTATQVDPPDAAQEDPAAGAF